MFINPISLPIIEDGNVGAPSQDTRVLTPVNGYLLDHSKFVAQVESYPLEYNSLTQNSQTTRVSLISEDGGAQGLHEDGTLDEGLDKKKNKKSKSTKVKEKDRSVILGDGPKFDEIIDTAERVMVGRVNGRRYSATWLKK